MAKATVKVTTVDAYRAALTAEQRATVDRLRDMAAGAADGVTEHIKWNAPSFCIAGDDRITLGTDAKGAVRVILHRGVKAKDTTGFAFAAPDGLVTWAAVDRGVMSFASVDAVAARAADIADVFKRWLEETA